MDDSAAKVTKLLRQQAAVAGFGEAAKGGAQVAHEHGRGDTFAGNIAEHKEQTGVGFEEVAVIAANHARGLIVVAHIPAKWREV